MALLAINAHAQPTASTLVRDIETLSPNDDTQSDTTPITLSSIRVQGNRLISTQALQPLLARHTGTTTLAGLHDLARQIEDHYQKAGYPLVSVIVPPQTIEGGTVVLQVIETQIDSSLLQNHSLVNDRTVQRLLQSHIKTGTPLSQKTADTATALIRQLSGVGDVQQSLSVDDGRTTLITTLTPSPRLTGTIQLDNYGSASTGKMRVNANMAINSPLGLGDELSVQAMTSFKGVHHAKADIKLPIAQGASVNLGAGHTRYELGGSFKDLNAKGTAQTATVGIRYPLAIGGNSPIWLGVSADNKNLTDTIGSTNTQTDKNIKALTATVSGKTPTQLAGAGSLQYSLGATLGKLDIKSADAKALDAASAKTQGGYAKASAQLSHAQFIGQNLSLHTAVNAQWASKNLDPSEQMSLGGTGGVSAYHSNDFSADTAIIGKAEARYAISPYLSVGGFYDAGKAKPRQNPYTKDSGTQSLQGFGISVYGNYQSVSAESKLAWQGNKTPMAWLQLGYHF